MSLLLLLWPVAQISCHSWCFATRIDEMFFCVSSARMESRLCFIVVNHHGRLQYAVGAAAIVRDDSLCCFLLLLFNSILCL